MEQFKEIYRELRNYLVSPEGDIGPSLDMVLDCAMRMWATQYIQNSKPKPSAFGPHVVGQILDNNPSEKQLSFASSLGIAVPTGTTKGQLRGLIDAKVNK